MLINMPKDVLSNYLDTVEKALPTRSAVSNICNILMVIDGNNLSFTATNLELDIKVIHPYASEEQGEILLPPKIVEIVRYLPEAEISLNVNWENYRVDVTCGTAKYVLYGADPCDFPLIETAASVENKLVLEQNYLKHVLREVVFAASTDESRPAFNGVLFQFKESTVVLNSSDTYRLVVKEMASERLFNEGRYLIPAKALRELLKILNGAAEVSIFPHKNQIVFNLGEVYFATRVLEEKYPDVSGVIPLKCRTKIILLRKSLEETIGRASLLSEGINQAVQLVIGDEDELEVKVSSQVGRMEERFSVSKEGEKVEVLVNSKFVMDFLKVVDSKEIIIEFYGKNGPLLFKVPGEDDYLYLVLPIKTE